MFKIDVDTKLLRDRIKRIPIKVKEDTRAFLIQEAEQIIGDAKQHYVPVRDGTLRDSGFVDEPRVTTGEIIVEAGFGGPAADYALVQHERTDFVHSVGEAKYLEKPFNASLVGFDQRMAKMLEDSFEK